MRYVRGDYARSCVSSPSSWASSVWPSSGNTYLAFWLLKEASRRPCELLSESNGSPSLAHQTGNLSCVYFGQPAAGGGIPLLCETVWSHLKRGVGNIATGTLDQLAVIIRTRLKQMQYRPGLLDAFVTHTGLIASPGSK